MDLTLHIGAHRTGSTMVERTIMATIEAHPGCGVAIWGPRQLRDLPGFKSTASRLDEDIEPVSKAAAIGLDALASRIATDVAAERARGVHTLILSEENFVGSMGHNFRTGQFYPDVAHRLAAFDSLLPLSPRKIALGVRNYAPVWTSAFQYLPQVGKDAPPTELAHSALMGNRRGWPQVVEAVGKVWPETALLMWQQEHLGQGLARICAAMTGLPVEQIVVPEGKMNARKKDRAGSALFSVKERKHLQRRYTHHIKLVKAEPHVTWAGEPEP